LLFGNGGTGKMRAMEESLLKNWRLRKLPMLLQSLRKLSINLGLNGIVSKNYTM
jgi:hypothetical protein